MHETPQKILKYFIMFASLFAALNFVPSNKMDNENIVIISMIGTTVFCLLDMFMPVVICAK